MTRGGTSSTGSDSNSRRSRKLDLAARAAWLYYIAGNTQEEIAKKLNVSRQAAQRLVALAVGEKLIKFRLDHPLNKCIALAEALRDRFHLAVCEVIPSGPHQSRIGLGICAAAHLETYLETKTPIVIGLSSGRTLHAMVEQVPAMEQSQHEIVSIIGNMSQRGQAGRHEVVMRLCDRTGAVAYPMPTPVVAASVQEKELLQTQQSFTTIKSLIEQATVTFVGVGDIRRNCPLQADGFIDDDELYELIDLGAIGEIAGWAYDKDGRLLEKGTNQRVASVPLEQPVRRLVIAVAGGLHKTAAIHAALKGKLISGLITDETGAEIILSTE